MDPQKPESADPSKAPGHEPEAGSPSSEKPAKGHSSKQKPEGTLPSDEKIKEEETPLDGEDGRTAQCEGQNTTTDYEDSTEATDSLEATSSTETTDSKSIKQSDTSDDGEGVEEDSGDGMSFLDHLEELRLTIGWSLASWLAGILAIGLFLRQAADLLHWPLNISIGEDILLQEGLITTSPLGVFSVMLQVLLVGGLLLALPLILYFIARFLAPGLTIRERAILRPGLMVVAGLFLLGAAFAFFVLTPAALAASKAFNELFGFRVYWAADKYYGLLSWMMLSVGLTFQFPLVLLILVHLGFLSRDKLRAGRPYAVVAFLAFAAVVTPTTDPITFLLLAVPMAVLYELSIWGAKIVETRREKALQRNEDTLC